MWRGRYGHVRPKPTVVNGIHFPSKLEAIRYQQLLILQNSGLIRDLRMQVKFDCSCNGVHICNYVSDFVYLLEGKQVVEDVKGILSDVFRLKKRLMLACNGIEVVIPKVSYR